MADAKQDKKSRIQELDDFWDLSSIVPRRTLQRTDVKPKNTHAVDVSGALAHVEPKAEESTVIKRYINPLHYENKKIRKEAYEGEEIYYPENSLLHRVTLRKRKCEYELYAEFYEDALKYKSVEGKECEFAAFYSYVPQYNQLNQAQLSYYLWWRECFEKRVFIKTEQSYVLLYIFELINTGSAISPAKACAKLCEIWNVYHEEFVSIARKLAIWICDFCLLYKLSAPDNISPSVSKYSASLKEFYLHIPNGDFESCARSLIKYGNEYDYRTSKFAKAENLKLFDKYVLGAVLTAVRFYSKNGVMLSELASQDSKMIRNAFEGALCISSLRYEIEVKYCSLSRSNELRYLMADIVKYAENKIRRYIGVKSKLTVYSVSTELQKELDAYFEKELFSIPKVSAEKEERHEYDVLYELPKTKLSLDNAKRIENASWNVTRDLVSAFEEEKFEDIKSAPIAVEAPPLAESAQQNRQNEEGLRSKLGEYLAFADAVKSGDALAWRTAAAALGKLDDAVVDAINEIAVDEIGDVLIEECDGRFVIVECYLDMI